ncbi:MAG: hypothetical protein JWQ19_2069 [Subtercola sp.]|nr:hypothetical protein [Subtercola sp.]
MVEEIGMAMTASGVDDSFVLEAVERADLNALRVALYQATRNPEVRDMKVERVVVRAGAAVITVLAESDRERLVELAVEFLTKKAIDYVPVVPTAGELDQMIPMVEGREVSARDLTMRRGIPAFEEFPREAAWSGERPASADSMKVLIVGAGFAGIAMGVQLSRLGIPYQILERRSELGGVWSINTYPDARTDTHHMTYQFGFEKNYPWTEHFARQPEVRHYLEYVAEKYGVLPHIRFDHDVVEAAFDSRTATWVVDVAVGDTRDRLEANIVISASGLFATPRYLDAPGVDEFEGEIIHTTEWGRADIDGKNVAVVGNGSTGVQLLGAVARRAKTVSIYQRTPQWISPRELYGSPLSEHERWLRTAMPYYWNWCRYTAVLPMLDMREFLLPDREWIAQGGQVNEKSDLFRKGMVAYIRAQLPGQPDLVEKLIPDYAPLARRPVVDNGWYRALNDDHVDLVTAPIERVTRSGIRTTDGEERPIDVIVSATGFQTTKYLAPAEYRGVDGVRLEDAWSEGGPKAYLGMTVPGFPNFFMLYGPNSQPTTGGATIPGWFEIWSEYIGEAIVAMIENRYRTLDVRRDVYEDYNTRLDEAARELVYIDDTQSKAHNYYVNAWGRLETNIPWAAEEFFQWSSSPNLDDFVIDGELARSETANDDTVFAQRENA